MASIRAFYRFRSLPAAVAALLAVLGAVGFALWSGPAESSHAVVVDRSPSCEPPENMPADAISFETGNGSGALARAASRDVERVLLYTDAVFSRLPALPGKPVDVVLRPRRDDVGVLDVRAPSRVPVGVDFRVEATVGRTGGPARTAVDVVVEFTRAGERVGAPRTVRLRKGQRALVAVRDRVDGNGIVRYEARVRGGPGDPANDVGMATVRVGHRPVVLAVGDAFSSARIEFVESSPTDAAAALTRLGDRVDAVLLTQPLRSNQAQEAVVEAVRGGAGLLVVGGDGYAGRPLEKILPLTDRPPGGRATVLLLDFSGSMEPLLDTLSVGVRRLLGVFAPDDSVALLAFRDAVQKEWPWRKASNASWERGTLRAHGNTNLAPALQRARALLADVKAQERRIFIVSDGEWQDIVNVRAALERLREVKTSVLFVGEKQPHKELFDGAYTSGDDLAAALEDLARTAPDKRIKGPVRATRGNVAAWLQGLPPAGPYDGAVRLYARGVGERVALLDDEKRPLLATLEPGGRVIVVGLDGAPLEGLLLACVRPDSEIELRARREGDALVLEAAGKPGFPHFLVGDRKVAARPRGRNKWGARLAAAPPGALTVRFGPATAGVPPAAAAELEGLFNRPDLAARIAQRSGGRYYGYSEETPPDDRPAELRAVWATLLLAAGCVVWSAVVRRAA